MRRKTTKYDARPGTLCMGCAGSRPRGAAELTPTPLSKCGTGATSRSLADVGHLVVELVEASNLPNLDGLLTKGDVRCGASRVEGGHDAAKGVCVGGSVMGVAEVAMQLRLPLWWWW